MAVKKMQMSCRRFLSEGAAGGVAELVVAKEPVTFHG
jgi:hypothetical protein